MYMYEFVHILCARLIPLLSRLALPFQACSCLSLASFSGPSASAFLAVMNKKYIHVIKKVRNIQ